jgi:hypothetical protein
VELSLLPGICQSYELPSDKPAQPQGPHRASRRTAGTRTASIKVLSSNQLKSGDLSIRTATSSEVEAIKQFADNWIHRIGHRATVRIPTYGVLAHSIRTSTRDMDRFEETRDHILLDYRPCVPQAEIRYIGWLTRNAHPKAASSVVIGFTKPEDASKTIDEGLLWQGEVSVLALLCVLHIFLLCF